MRRRTKLLVALTLIAIGTIVVSLTLGRELFAGRTPSLASFAIVNFAGYLFFLTMPVEALVPYYQSLGHHGVVLVGLAVSTALGAQIIDYGIGHSVRTPTIDAVVGRRRHRRATATLERHGGWAIFLFNLTPLSSPILMLVAGMLRYRLRRAFTYSAAGLVIKYVLLVFVFRGVF